MDGSQFSFSWVKSKLLPSRMFSCHFLNCICECCIRDFKSSIIVYPFSNSIWMDSVISSSPNYWKTFVVNCVTQIRHFISIAVWNHVPSDHNPADCLARFVSPCAE
ncbi:hypothetical protein PR048_003669 [Dryococelus australis]|uniref:Uncharacterized protein n=1 Tax=Dryococelus australis TaxID=614101 RepID=A0ABQ9INT4_9NEOP|nr:hypothetical protein PR048_003669 [Dryococelus australis]